MKKVKKKAIKRTVSKKKPVKSKKPKKTGKPKSFVRELVEDVRLPSIVDVMPAKPKRKALYRLTLVVLAGVVLFIGYLILDRLTKQSSETPVAPIAETPSIIVQKPVPGPVKVEPPKPEAVTGGDPMNFAAAVKFCKTKRMRLPTLGELQETQKTASESLKKGNQYWSSTREKKGDFVNVVSMADGNKNASPKTSRFRVICVKK